MAVYIVGVLVLVLVNKPDQTQCRKVLQYDNTVLIVNNSLFFCFIAENKSDT